MNKDSGTETGIYKKKREREKKKGRYLLTAYSCCCSVTKLGPTLCNPKDCNMPGFSVLHYFLEFAQIHVHWVSDVIQPSHPLLPPSPPPQSFPASGSFPMSWLFESGGQSIGTSASASVRPMSIQCCFPLGLTGLISLQSNRLSRVFSSTTIQKHQFFGAQPSLWSNSHVRTWLLEKPHLWLYRPFYQGVATPGKDQTTETCAPGQRMNQVF